MKNQNDLFSLIPTIGTFNQICNLMKTNNPNFEHKLNKIIAKHNKSATYNLKIDSISDNEVVIAIIEDPSFVVVINSTNWVIKWVK